MGLKRHIPNFFTSLNIVSGSIAIYYALQSDLEMAFVLICFAAFFDFIDGGVARLLKTQSAVGKELDSLCDVVSFGVAPGMIMFEMQRQALGVSLPLSSLPFVSLLFLLSAILLPVFSAIRLAKFNIDTRQTDSFIGLPVPANALLIASLGLALAGGSSLWLVRAMQQPVILLLLTLVQSYLLVSPLPMFALKFKHLKWQGNQLRFLFLIGSVIVLVLWGMASIAIIIFSYVMISLIVSILRK